MPPFESKKTTLQEHPSSTSEEDKISALQEQIKRVWQKVLDKQDIGLEENFFDAGGDSLLLPHLLFMLQEELNAKFEFIDLATFPNIKQFAEFLTHTHGRDVL